MQQLILTPSVATDFRTYSERVEVVDEAGVRLGFFVPETARKADLYERAHRLFSEDELKRRQQEPGSFASQEVWARIAELERSQEGRGSAAHP